MEEALPFGKPACRRGRDLGWEYVKKIDGNMEFSIRKIQMIYTNKSKLVCLFCSSFDDGNHNDSHQMTKVAADIVIRSQLP